MVRLIRPALCSALLLASSSAFAADLDPQKAAQIQLDRDRALGQVKQKYGSKKLSEMSNDEKKALARDTADAEQKALDKNGVSAKEWSRYEATMNRSERAATEKAKEDLLKKEEAEKKAAEKKKAEAAAEQQNKEIPVQQGFSDEQPTVMEESKDAPPIIERGKPEGESEEPAK